MIMEEKLKGKNYMITDKNIRNHELIGLSVKVVNSSDPGRKNLEGKIIDETKNTLKILVGEEEKILPKKECVFEFNIGEKVLVNGNEIMKRAQDRING
jgi:ribonuclease P protein subunit POP4